MATVQYSAEECTHAYIRVRLCLCVRVCVHVNICMRVAAVHKPWPNVCTLLVWCCGEHAAWTVGTVGAVVLLWRLMP